MDPLLHYAPPPPLEFPYRALGALLPGRPLPLSALRRLWGSPSAVAALEVRARRLGTCA